MLVMHSLQVLLTMQDGQSVRGREYALYIFTSTATRVPAAMAKLLHCVTCRYYVTPRSYLDLLQQYSHLLGNARMQLGDKRRRLLDGIAKLRETNATLDAMHNQLNQLQPLLAEKTAATSTLLQQV